MPSANITFVEFGSASPPASAARVVAKIGICSAGSTNSVYAFDVPGPVAGALGEGPLTEATAQAVRISKQRTLALPVEKNAPGELGPITQEGSGPALLVTGEPRDSATVRVKITKEGGLGVGRFRVSTSGTAAGAAVVPFYRGELTIPTRKRAEVTGTRDLSKLVYAKGGKAGTLDGKTLTIREGNGPDVAVVFTPPPSGPADVVAKLSAVSNVDAGLVAPASKLRLSSKTIGAGSSFAIIGGDACEALGLPIAATKGAEATAVVPGLGVVIEFPEGAYAKDTVYTFATVAPSISIEGVLAAIDKLVALRASFRILHVVGELADAAETRALAEALDTKSGDLEDKKRPIIAIIGAPLAESDEALAAAFDGFVSRRVCVCARGAWLRGGTLTGSFLRSQSWAAAYKAAAFRYSSDLGNHDDKPLPEVDALPVDEALATVKLRAARFTVMDTSGGNVYFARGLTMARDTSHYRDLNVARVMIEAYLAAQPILDNEINNDPPLNDDGTLEGTTAGAIDRAVVNALAAELVPEHATRVIALVNRADNLHETNHLRAQIKIVPRGQIYEVSAELGPGLAISEEG